MHVPVIYAHTQRHTHSDTHAHRNAYTQRQPFQLQELCRISDSQVSLATQPPFLVSLLGTLRQV